MKNQAHEFAIFSQELNNLNLKNNSSKFDSNSIIVFKDKNLYHRLISILRFEVGHELIIFDQINNFKVKILSLNKNGEIKFEVLSKNKNKVLTPELIWVLPILKKQALEDAVYSLAEIGANQIQLVITEKSQKNFDDKLLSRLNSIVISGAEQSKNFSFPEILAPIKLAELNLSKFINKIYFDPDGDNIAKLITELNSEKNSNIIAMCGPEGDLTEQEKEFIKTLGFNFYALTPTVLRSSQAVAIGSGILRSI